MYYLAWTAELQYSCTVRLLGTAHTIIPTQTDREGDIVKPRECRVS